MVRRRFEPSTRHSGYVLEVGFKWDVLARVAEGGFFDGHIAFRLADLEDVRADASF